MKSRIGPLALEAPLGTRSNSGQVFRAIHVEQRKLLAVRVFPIPLGLTPESRQEFAAQLEGLKQLRHPSIVRCYGGGFDERLAYLVYELIDGQSLDQILAKRERLTWETAFQYGKQLADALQVAHLMGWVHGRIRPEKLLIPNVDATNSAGAQIGMNLEPIKLTDFRRDAIASAIGGNAPSLDDLQFMAPEQLLPDSVADEKCDLYALGAVLYTMLVGRPPLADCPSDQLIQAIQRTVPPSVQSQVLDCPIWLSIIIDQLLSKDPRARPFGAAAVVLAFKEAERRASEGVGVLQHATGGFSALQLRQTNRTEAEKVLGIKHKKARPQRDFPIWESAAALSVTLLACIGLVVWLLLPPGRETLRYRSEKLMASKEYDDWDYARDLYLSDLVTRFPGSEDAEWAQQQIDYVNSVDSQRRLERMARLNRTPEREIERRYVDAWRYEQFGDRVTALAMYRSMVKILSDDPADRPVVTLAQRRIAELETLPPESGALKRLLMSKLEEADELYKKSSVRAAREVWESIVSLYSENQELAEPVTIAKSKLEELKK